MTDDRRATIEAAMDAVESNEPEIKVVEPVQTELDLGTEEVTETPESDTESAKAEVATGVAKSEPKATPSEPSDKAPQSWRPTAKAAWDKLPTEIRQEVARREKQTTQVLNESAQARHISDTFQRTVQPYMARINAVGDPMKAVQNLLQADHLLSSAPKQQRAVIIASLIQDYGVDIETLDNVLSGKVQAVDPIQAKVDALLQQKLAPYEQFISQQRQAEMDRQQQETQGMQQTIEQMASDPKYPHFDSVRGDMADLIELSTKKGLYLSLEQAYNKAVQWNPEISKLSAAAKDNAIAQRAKKASSSVGGAPSGLLSGSSTTADRRATIAAAFDSLGGR